MDDILRRLLHYTGDGVFRYTFDDGIVLEANRGFVKILDLDCAPEDLVGKPLNTLATYTQEEGSIRRALEEHGEIHGFPYRFKTLKGDEKWVVHDSFLVEDPVTHARVVEAIVKDATVEMRAEEALAREHNLLRTLIDSLPDSIYFKNVDSRFVVANAAVAALMGARSREDLLGKTDFDYYPPDLAGRYFADESEIIRTGQSLVGREEPVVDAAGNQRWYLTTKLPVRDLHGNVTGIVGVGRDITKHRQVEEALLEALQRFEAVVENTPLVAIQGFDQGGYIRHWNPACTALYGFAAEEALGRRLQDILLAGKAAQDFERMLQYVWLTGKATPPTEWRVQTRTGEDRWVYSTIFPIFEHNQVIELFCMDVDITERKRAEEALRLDESRLEALLKLDQMADASLEEITNFALEEAIRLAGSTLGYLAFLNDDESVLTMYAWSRTAMEECRIADKPLVYPVVTTGLWGEAVRQRRPVITNDYAAPNPCKKGYPEGHVELSRHMNVPIFDGDHMVLVAGVGNKSADYDETDVRQLTLLMTGMWRIVQRKNTQQALQESETKYHTLFNMFPDASFLGTITGEVLDCNSSACEMYGYDRDKLIGLTVADLVPEEFIDELRGEIVERLKAGSLFVEAPGKRRNGEIFPTEVSAILLTIGGKQVVLVHVRDVTHRKRGEQALRDSEVRLRTILQSIQSGVLVVDAETRRILDASAKAAEMIGLPLDHIIGEVCHRFICTEREGRCPVIDLGEEVDSSEQVLTRADGKQIPVIKSVASVVLNNRKTLIESFLDISERKRAEEDRRKLETQILQAQKLESLGILAGGIAHDFNNLLTGILGHASLALMELSPTSSTRESVEQIERTARRAAELTKQMLAYSGKGKFNVQAINLSEVVGEMGHLLEVSISKKCTLKYDFARDLPAIDADVTQIRQVIMNLIINASEAIGDRNGTITIHTGTVVCDRAYLADTYLDENQPEGLYVYLEVADTGSGMTAETRAKLFDPFFTTKFTGRGLGLAALLGIVRGHKGAVKVYSEVDRGTSFKTLFPVSRRAVASALGAGPAPQAVKGTGTILVVDDEEIVRVLAQDILEDAGYKVLLANDGREGVELFSKHPDEIRAVILDLTMPHMDGAEAFADMRRVSSDVPIILSSGYNEQDATERFVGKGLAGFIHKPYSAVELTRLIADAVKSSEKHRDRGVKKPRKTPPRHPGKSVPPSDA